MAGLISLGRLREVLEYDPETGVFTWIVNRGGLARPGSRAGTERPDGYTIIVVDGRFYLAHRLAWFYTTGGWPPDDIDHINGDPSNNRIDNLRPATRSQNNANGRKPRHNASGFKGVSFDRQTGKWRAKIQKDGKLIHLGRFSTPEAAHAVYSEATARLNGAFARAA